MTKYKITIFILSCISVCLIIFLIIFNSKTFNRAIESDAMDSDSSISVATKNENSDGNGSADDALFDEYETILTKSSKDFIGNENVDESFLSWVVSTYGQKVIDDIYAQNEFSDPEIWFQETGKTIHVLYSEYCISTGLDYPDVSTYQTAHVNDDGSCTLLFSGDLSMADDIATTTYMLEQPDKLKGCFSSDLLQKMLDADVFEINNEFAYTTRGTPIPGKAFTFRGNPEKAKYLKDIGVDVVSLANNHVFDYGVDGIMDTFATLDSVGMPYVGAGKNIEEAEKPVYFIAGGRKIALVAATQIERSYNYTKEATDTTPGVLKTLDPEKYISVISDAKKNSDIVIAIVHWGTEGNSYYGTDQTVLAKKFIDAGADAVIGGHTHCLQGIEIIDDIPVYYSLGNFWFSSTMNMPAGYDTGLAELKINNDGTITPSFIPCHFSNGITSLVTDEEQKAAIFQKIEKYSNTTEIDDSGTIKKKG